MSFVLGLKFNNVGILIADTRLNLAFKDGSQTVNDVKPVTVDLETNVVFHWGIRERKLAILKNGFAASAGDAILGHALLSKLKGHDLTSDESIESLISATSSELRKLVLSKLPDSSQQFDKTSLMVMVPKSLNISLSMYTAKGWKAYDKSDFLVYWPPEIDKALSVELAESIQKTYLPNDLDDVYQIISKLSGIAYSVHKNSVSVSPTIEFGLTIVNDDGCPLHGYGYGLAEHLSKATPRQVATSISLIK